MSVRNFNFGRNGGNPAKSQALNERMACNCRTETGSRESWITDQDRGNGRVFCTI